MRRLPLMMMFLALAGLSPSAFAQNGPLQRVGRALDRAGQNIRNRVEMEVARSQITAAERDVLGRVMMRLEWDKKLAGSALRLEAQPGGTVVLRGSVASEAAKARAVDLAGNTIGVTRVVDELAVPKDVKVIETPPVAAESAPVPLTGPQPATVIESEPVQTPTPTPTPTAPEELKPVEEP